MNKRKSHSQITTSGLHYVLDTPLEQAAERMLQLQLDGYVVLVMEFPGEDDCLEMSIRRKWTRTYIAEVQVLLKRWQGTQTRIDMQTQKPGYGVWRYIICISLFAIPIIGILVGLVVIFQQYVSFNRRIKCWQLSSDLMQKLDKHIDDIKVETLHFGKGLSARIQAEDLFDMDEDYTSINDEQQQ
jgi:hypothetical protein